MQLALNPFRESPGCGARGGAGARPIPFRPRICCSSDVFLKVGGYNEDLDPVGYEDRGCGGSAHAGSPVVR